MQMNTRNFMFLTAAAVAGAHVVPAVVKGLAAPGTATRTAKITHFLFGSDAPTVDAAVVADPAPAV